MSALSNIPYDIVVFAVLTIVLVWRLRAVLGQRVNVENASMRAVSVPASMAAVTEKPSTPDEPSAKYDIPAPSTRVGQVLNDISEIEPGFCARTFLDKARNAFCDIVTAYALGERDKLRQYMTPSAWASFDSAITAREEAHQKQRTEIVDFVSLSIVDALIVRDAIGKVVRIDVQIVSRQISLLNDVTGQPLIGTESITEFSDLWQFERAFGSVVPTSGWCLAAARAA